MAIRFDEIQLTGSGTNSSYPTLSNAAAQTLNIQTSHGYLRLGSDNGSYAHITTDRPLFYFNKPVSFDGNIAGYGGDETASFATYYDSQDTNYYVDPNGQSRMSTLNLGSSPTSGITGGYIAQIRGHMHMTNNEINYVSQLHFNDNVRFYDEGNDSYLNFKFGDASAGGIKMIDGDGNYHGMFYADGNTQIGILDSDSNWAVQVVRDSAVYLKVNDTTRFYIDNGKAIVPAGTMLKVGNSSTYNSDDSSWGSRLQVASTIHARLDVAQDADAMRATLYAHTGNTGPFFGTTTNHPMNLFINASEIGHYDSQGLCLSASGTHLGLGTRNYPKIVYPGKNAGWADNGASTGEIIIHLPGTLANYDMMYMEIEVYEYSAKNATKIVVGGHNWNSGGNSGTSNACLLYTSPSPRDS